MLKIGKNAGVPAFVEKSQHTEDITPLAISSYGVTV